MGALNVSPESFYSGSVHIDVDALLEAAQTMVESGAVLIDVGARSTAPYLPTAIDEEEEVKRLSRAIGALAAKLDVPISADTAGARPARAALGAGARVVNDVSGSRSRTGPPVGAAAGVDRHGLAGDGEPLTGPLATVAAAGAAPGERTRRVPTNGSC
jgi:dihydropteroate synthase